MNLLHEIQSLCIDDLFDISILVDSLLKEKLMSKVANHEIINRESSKHFSCPTCGSHHYKLNGKTPAKRQKYLCKQCNKSFSDTTNTIINSSKKSYKEWFSFIQCEFNRLTLKQTAEQVGISITTAFFWRHKLHKSIENYLKPIKLSGKIQLDATYRSINLKGSPKSKMPRLSKKRPGSSMRGISHHKVCIMSGIDDNDNMFFEIAGLGRESINCYKHISHHLDKVSLLITDQSWGFTTYAKELNCELDQIPTSSYVSNLGNTLAELNGLHSQLASYLAKYRGVSTRHLQGYLNMFIFLKTMKYKYEKQNLLKYAYINSIPSNSSMTNNEVCNKLLPIDLFEAYGSYKFGCFA